jgi:hypothetical protein
VCLFLPSEIEMSHFYSFSPVQAAADPPNVRAA